MYSKEKAYMTKLTQLSPYFYACKTNPVWADKVTKVGIDVITSNKHESFNFTPERWEYDKFIEDATDATKIIKSGAFLPCDDAQTCSWCGYRSLCRKGVKVVSNLSFTK